MKIATKSLMTCIFLISSILISTSSNAQNIIQDGDFPADTLPSAWSSFIADFAGVSATVGVTNNQATITNITGAGGETWHVQLNQIFSSDQISALEVDATYEISFDASSPDSGRALRMYFGEDGGSFTALKVMDTTLTASMTNFKTEVVVTQVFGAMKLGFELGLSNSDVVIDNVVLTKKLKDVVIDGDFPADTLPSAWSSFIADFAGVSATVGVTNNEATITNIAGAGGETWHVQLNQVFSSEQIGELAVDETYRVEFDASSPDSGRALRMYFGEDGGSFSAIEVMDTTLSTVKTTYSTEFTLPQVFGAMKLGFELGLSNSDVTIDNVRLLQVTGGETEPEPLPQFGDNRILFVDGPDLTVPKVDGEVVDDIIEAGNKVHKFTGGGFFQLGYFWDNNGLGGIDFTQNINDVDTVYIRLRINPADHTADDTGLRATGSIVLADVTNNTNSNLQWGISWSIPADAYDNQWHEYAIPLPKPTIAEHDSAMKDLDLNGNPLPANEQYSEIQKRWSFPDAWNGSVNVSPNDPELGGDPDWDKLGRVALSLNNDRSGTFYVDNFYIGSEAATDLSVALEKPDSPGVITAAATEGEMNISWAHDNSSNIFAYELYYSGETITSVEAAGVKKIGQYLANASLGFKHEVSSPHPGDASHDYHYALVPTTSFGVSDPTVFTTTSVSASGNTTPYIFELSSTQEIEILSDLDNGTITGAGWPTDSFEPFTLKLDDVPESDASAKIWVGFGRSDDLNTVYMYMEVLDDDILGGPGSDPSGMYGTTLYPRASGDEATTWIPTVNDNDNNLEWNYYLKDQIKIHFGTYGVNYVSGTTNEDRSRGTNPDYFIALQPKISGDATANGPDGMLTRFWVTEPNTTNPDVDYNTLYYSSNHLFTYSALYENMMDGETRIGWKALIAFDANDLLVATDESQNPIDSPFEFPSAAEIKYLPMTLELYDKDSGDGGNWWENPSHVISYPTAIGGSNIVEWTDDLAGIGVVAMAGSDVSTSIDINNGEIPLSFALEQNYPNPFNPSTSIKFSIPKSSDVTLNVFNVLGQRVATLVNKETFKAGSYTVNFDASNLSSGMYIYRLQAGEFLSVKKMMLIK